MVLKVSSASLHWSQPSVSHSPSSSQTLALALSSPSSLRRRFVGGDGALCYRYVGYSALFLGAQQSSMFSRSRSGNSNRSRVRIIRRALTASLDSFSDEEFSKNVQDMALRFRLHEDDFDVASAKVDEPVETRPKISNCEVSFFENHNLFDVLEPPDFPEREEIIPANIERIANSFEIPMSLRIIKRKKQWQEGFMEAGESACCSVKKAFSSMVFIIRELYSYTLQMREILFYENLQGVLANVQMEMHASFVWLFQKVFSETPTLMVYVMILLANYSVYSMSSNSAIAASSPAQSYASTMEEVSSSMVENQSPSINRFDSSMLKTFKLSSSSGKTASVGGNNGGGGGHKPIASGTDGEGRFNKSNYINGGSSVLNPLWNSEEEMGSNIEADDQEEYFKTELLYQTQLVKEPNNSLLLANYAQFLFLVACDFDRAEDYFKRATEVEPKDAEALNKYANFLWHVRGDLWAAEATYLEAISVEPSNSYYAANYAHFLWNTGGEDTCFPLI